MKCPDCDGPMVLRTNRKTLEEFYGCADYPKCKGTRDVEDYGSEDEAHNDDLPSSRMRSGDRKRWEK